MAQKQHSGQLNRESNGLRSAPRFRFRKSTYPLRPLKSFATPFTASQAEAVEPKRLQLAIRAARSHGAAAPADREAFQRGALGAVSSQREEGLEGPER